MKLNAAHKQALIALEAPLDAVLFGVTRGADGKFYNEDGTEATGVQKTVGGAVGTAAVVGGGLYGKKKIGEYANSPGVNDRLAGLRATTPGFTQKTPFMQRATATASRAVDDVTGAVKSGASKLGEAATAAGTAVRTSTARGLAQGAGLFDLFKRGGRAGFGAARKKLGFSAKTAAVVELAAALPEVTELGAFIPESQTGQYDPQKDFFSERNKNKRAMLGVAGNPR